MILFKRRDLEQYTDSLAAYLPGGRLFEARSVQNSNFRKLLRGMAGELFNANGLLKEYSEDFLPDVTVNFIGEWEKMLGIPDHCFDGQGTLDQRRRAVLVKLAASGVQTADDFIALGATFGVTVEITQGAIAGIFPMTFPIVFFDSTRQARFTIIITMTSLAVERFPYTFPITFEGDELEILKCLFSRLKPANSDIIFRQI